MNDVIFCFLITVNVFGKPIPWNTMFNNTCRWTFTPRPSPNFVWENYSSANRLALIQHATMDDYYGALVRSSWVFVWSSSFSFHLKIFLFIFFPARRSGTNTQDKRADRMLWWMLWCRKLLSRAKISRRSSGVWQLNTFGVPRNPSRKRENLQKLRNEIRFRICYFSKR